MKARLYIISMLVIQCAAMVQPTFEVASIKPAPFFTPAELASGNVRLGVKITPLRAEFGFMTLEALIAEAYRVPRQLVVGAAAISTQPYYIVAAIPPGVSRDEVPEMLQALLAERWKLKIHREQKEQNVYALLVAHGGPALEITGDQMDELRTEKTTGAVRITATRISMQRLAAGLSGSFDRPVIDMTGLQGVFRFSIRVPEQASAMMPDDILHSLGLRLEKRRAVVERIVVDHAEKEPSGN